MDTALSVTPQNLLALCAETPVPLVIDVRREAVFQSAPDLIAGAVRRDPAMVADWAVTLPAAQHIVVYCVHGHEVSQNAAKALRDRGLPAQFLEGGLEAWRAAGGNITANPAQTVQKKP
jgi:rhodanese-related sulfurtransferase